MNIGIQPPETSIVCLAVIALDAHPRYRLVIAANRDEWHARPARPADWWDEGWLAGRDLSAGGTWLGIDRRGRWALLTNVREPNRKNPDASTRGTLVTDVLRDPLSALDALSKPGTQGHRYNGFNLVAGDVERAWWLSNREGGPHGLQPGIHALSNAALDTPWPKVIASRNRLARWCATGDADLSPAFDALASRECAPDDELPHTGVPIEWERRLSAPFIASPEYGTRCSTIIGVGHDEAAIFIERSFDATGALSGTVEHRFKVSAARA